MVVSGDMGVLRVGHTWAANLRTWRLTRSDTPESLGDSNSTLMALVVAIDHFWATQTQPPQPPMRVGLWMGGPDGGWWWVWQVDKMNDLVVNGIAEIVVHGDPTVVANF